jgi:hypothetical protein
MNVSTIILLAVITMTATTFITSCDCRHACKMNTQGVIVSQPSN